MTRAWQNRIDVACSFCGVTHAVPPLHSNHPMHRNALDITPRAIAVLVALRNGPLTATQLRSRIGDGGSAIQTLELLRDMRLLGLVAQVVESNQTAAAWYLDHDGIGWLQTSGLDAVPEARLWVAIERAAAAQ